MPPVKDPIYISTVLTEEEQEIIQAARSAESFRDTAWDQYGPDWVNHVPTAINVFVFYYFGCILFPYGLAEYYCPTNITEITIHGGRGSGKTDHVGLVWATYHAMHPGANWLHLSITKDQAKRAFDAITTWGSSVTDHPNFMNRFVSDSVSAPFPELRFNRWSAEDPGTICRFRSLGDENIERLRSLTAGVITVDEAFRDVETDATYAQLRGCLRGTNMYYLNLLPKEERERFKIRMGELASVVDPREKAKEEKKLAKFMKEHGLNIRGLMLLQGNAGPHEWEWQRHDKGRNDPLHYWSITVTSRDNPYFGQENLEALERSFGENQDLMEVEMLARRPRNLGDVFRSHVVNPCIDKEALQICARHMNEGDLGWEVRIHTDYDVYLYGVPPIPGHMHVIGADPGTGMAPGRNKWSIMVFDISVLPVRMVYFEIGYIAKHQTGSYLGFLATLRRVMNSYPTGLGDTWVESSGPQKGMIQVSWPEGVHIFPVEFTGVKAELRSDAQLLLQHGYLRFPNIAQFLIEIGNYVEPDKDITQDCVMAFICACGAIWKYYGRKWEWEEPEEEDVRLQFDRDARTMHREVRWSGRSGQRRR